MIFSAFAAVVLFPWDLVSHPRRLWRRLGRAVSACVDALVFPFWAIWVGICWLRKLPHALLACVDAVGAVFRGTWAGIRRLRNWPREVWQSLPAVLTAGTALGLSVWIAEIPAHQVFAMYQQAGDKALSAGRLEAADLYYRKLSYLNGQAPQGPFGRALVAERRGEQETAARLMERIAPVDGRGYGPAHLWLARQLLVAAGAAANETAGQRLQSIERHLTSVLAEQPKELEAHRLLGQLYATTGRVRQAVEHLVQIADRAPESRLTLAQLYAVLGQQPQAESSGNAAREYFQRRLTEDTGDVEAGIGLARAELFLGKPEVAVEVLKQGWENTHDKRYRAELAPVYLSWFDRTSPDEPAERFALLKNALAYTPESEAALTRLQVFVGQKGPEAAQARQFLESRAAKENAPAVVHLLLGCMAVDAGDLEQGRMHLENAHRADPRAPLVANNLAWVLANSSPPNLNEALELINVAVDISPSQADIRETRGQILAKLGRYREAVADLELALPGLSNRLAVHKTLATAYRELGDTALAERHQQLAEKSGNSKE